MNEYEMDVNSRCKRSRDFKKEALKLAIEIQKGKVQNVLFFIVELEPVKEEIQEEMVQEEVVQEEVVPKKKKPGRPKVKKDE